jgi:putative DNA primase/helicase
MTQKDASQVEAFCKASNSDRGINAMIHLAQSDERCQASHTELDCHPFLLNCENGTLDLAIGELRAHDPADRLTQLAPVTFDRTADCPKWRGTVDLIFERNAELIRYVQAILAYCLSGDVSEHVLPIGIGGGENGKSTVWHVLLSILGPDYAMLANESLLMGEREGPPTEKAALFGKRFVPISEPERGAKLRESRVKELTGDSTITARRMKEDFWSFTRTHKFFLASNYLPKVAGTDNGIWRRLKVVPFNVKLSDVTTPVKGFEQLLVREESSGILNWLLEGFQDWQRHGFVEPEIVKQATGNYRSDSDPLGEWLADFCAAEPGAVALASEVFKSFDNWQEQQGIGERFRWSQTRFGTELAARFPKEKPTSGPFRKQVIYQGLRILTQSENTPENGDFFDLPPVAPSHPVNSIENRFPASQWDNRGQLGAEAESTPVLSSQKVLPSDPPKHVLRCKCGADVACTEWMGWLGGHCECGKVVKERKQ